MIFHAGQTLKQISLLVFQHLLIEPDGRCHRRLPLVSPLLRGESPLPISALRSSLFITSALCASGRELAVVRLGVNPANE